MHREWVLDLVRREAACCAFLSYEVDAQDGELVWQVSGGVGVAEMGVLDQFFSAPPSDPSSRIAEQLTEQGGVPVIVPANQG